VIDWIGKHAVVYGVIVLFLQRAWHIGNAYKHGSTVVDADVVQCASRSCVADDIDARA